MNTALPMDSMRYTTIQPVTRRPTQRISGGAPDFPGQGWFVTFALLGFASGVVLV